MTHVDKEITSNIVYHSGLKSSIDDLKLVAESVQNNLQDFNGKHE